MTREEKLMACGRLTKEDLQNPETYIQNAEALKWGMKKTFESYVKKHDLSHAEARDRLLTGQCPDDSYYALADIRKEYKREMRLDALTGEFHGYTVKRCAGKFEITGPYNAKLIEVLKSRKARYRSEDQTWLLPEKPLILKNILDVLPILIEEFQEVETEIREVADYLVGTHGELRVTRKNHRIYMEFELTRDLNDLMRGNKAYFDKQSKRWFVTDPDICAKIISQHLADLIAKKAAWKEGKKREQAMKDLYRIAREINRDLNLREKALMQQVDAALAPKEDRKTTITRTYRNYSGGGIPEQITVDGVAYTLCDSTYYESEYEGDGDPMVVAAYKIKEGGAA